MKSIHKIAGAMNILCAMLYMLSCIILRNFFDKEYLVDGSSIEIRKDSIYMLLEIAYWIMILGFPCAMTVAGGLMIFKSKESRNGKVFIFFNILIKICTVIQNLFLGWIYFIKLLNNFLFGGISLVIIVSCIILSIVLDCQLFKEI